MKKIKYLLMIGVVFIALICLGACETKSYKECTITYNAVGGGYIKGIANQTVEYGGNATTVIATELLGYRFVKWDDNDSTNPVRTDTNVLTDITANAIFEIIRTDIQFIDYLTDGNGKIEGQTHQQIVYDEDSSTVIAVPNEGYEFVQWSDGVTTAERQDINVKDSFTVTAQFKRVFKNYKLDYKLGTADTDITQIKFYDNNFQTISFPVPTRERFTFNGWYIGNEQVTDIDGNMLIGEELLEREEKEIYAKWTANENYTYKILMVYVTELDAIIPSVRGNGDFEVHYTMSDFDVKICKTITVQVRNYFNDLMDGLVTFEVDEYFTTEPVDNASITNGNVGNYIYACNIPEIYNAGIYRKYQCIFTVFCMNDYAHEFRTSAGAATNKYATVFLETVYSSNLINNEPLEYLLDSNYWRWNDIIETFMHEFAHTVELQIRNSYEYHSVISWAHKQLMYDHILMNKLYYLDLIEIDEKKVGIPIEFWKGELELIPPIEELNE